MSGEGTRGVLTYILGRVELEKLLWGGDAGGRLESCVEPASVADDLGCLRSVEGLCKLSGVLLLLVWVLWLRLLLWC